MKRQVAERRKNSRTELTRPGPMVEIADCASPAVLKNISASGLACVTDTPIPEMTMVEMSIHVPALHHEKQETHTIRCKGAVVRSEPIVRGNSKHKWSIAVYFTDLDEKTRKQLLKILETRS